MELLRVNKLEQGSTLGVYSPSEPITDSRKARFLQGLNILRSNGYNIKLSKGALERNNYVAGSTEHRLNDIHELLSSQDVHALISSWGGKSCNQLVRGLDYKQIAEQRKPFLGFSDPCVILNHITALTGLVTFYGPNVVGKLHETDNADLRILHSSSEGCDILSDTETRTTIVGGGCRGRLFGGNLSTFVLGVLCSNTSLRFFESGIFFWEDMSTPQLVIQNLTAIGNKGLFETIGGMVIGKLISEESKHWKSVDMLEEVRRFCTDFRFPILHAPVFGHEKLANPVIPIGPVAELDADNGMLVLQEPITK